MHKNVHLELKVIIDLADQFTNAVCLAQVKSVLTKEGASTLNSTNEGLKQ